MKTITQVLLVQFILLCSFAFAEQPLRVGVNIPLTGPLAEYGNAVLNGIELAKKDSPQAFQTIELKVEDNKYDGRTAVSVFQAQRNISHVDLVFVWGDIPSLAVAPIAEKTRIPTFAVLTDPTKVKNYHYLIRFLSSHFQYTEAMAEYLDSSTITNIGLIHSQSPYDTNHSTSLKLALKPSQRLTILGSVLPVEKDFRALILKAKQKHFQFLGLYIYPPQVPVFFRQAQELKFQVPIFGADAFESKDNFRQTNGRMENAIYASHSVDDSFLKRYLRSYGNDAQITYAANAFEFAKTLLRIRQKLKISPISSEEILSITQNLPQHIGALGPYKYEHTARDGQHFTFPIVIKRITKEGAEKVCD